MKDASVLRTLRGFIRPDTMESGVVVFDDADPQKWSARIEAGGHERWFKGLGKKFTEEIWTPNEDPHKQVCLP